MITFEVLWGVNFSVSWGSLWGYSGVTLELLGNYFGSALEVALVVPWRLLLGWSGVSLGKPLGHL